MQKADIPPSLPAFDCELLTVEQFADRLHVSRATVFSWMQRGVLSAGCHFIRLGRVVRFPWSADLVTELLKASMNHQATPCLATVKVRQPVRRNSSPVNWDY